MWKTALVVEDDHGMQEVVREALEGVGLQVAVAKDGTAAVKTLAQRLPDVVVVDLLLPQLGGYEFVETLRSMPGGAQVAVFVMSGIYKSSRHKMHAKEALGVVRFFEKPFALDELVKDVCDAVGLAPLSTKKRGPGGLPRAPKPVAHGSMQAEGFVDVPLAATAAQSVWATPGGNDDEDDEELDESPDEDDDDDEQQLDKRGAADRVIRGNLRNKKFPEVLMQLFHWGATGALLLRRGRVKKMIFVKEGFPVFAKSNLLSECLGRVLVRARMISEAECEQSLSAMVPRKGRPGRAQGAVLVEMGALSQNNLQYALQMQLEQKLFDVFAWPEGDYQFTDRAELPSQEVKLDMTPAMLVLEGVRRKYTDATLVQQVEPLLSSYVAPHAEPLQRLSDLILEPDERAFAESLDGNRTMKELVQSRLLPTRSARQLLYTLLTIGFVHLSSQPRRATLATPRGQAVPPLGPPSPASSSSSPSRGSPPSSSTSPPSSPPSSSTSPPSSSASPPSSSTSPPASRSPKPPPLPVPRVPSSATVSEARPTAAVAPVAASRVALSDDARGSPTVLEAAFVEEWRARLAERVRACRRRNHFEVLGVQRSASSDEIRRAFRALVRELHLDKRHNPAEGVRAFEARALAEQLYQQLTTAADTLTDEHRRQAYVTRLAPQTPSADGKAVARLLQADAFMKKGEVALERSRWGEAAARFRDAEILAPDDGEVAGCLAWARFLQNPDDADVQRTALERLQRATERSAHWDRGWLWLGRVQSRAGQIVEARACFERALVCNPDCHEARQELK
jgi:two-component system OmpR family response regulator